MYDKGRRRKLYTREYKVKCFCYRSGVAQKLGRGIDLLFHDRGTRRGWVVSSTPRLHFSPGKDPVSILQEIGWAPGPVWTGRKSRPHWDSIKDRPTRSQSLHRLNYPDHNYIKVILCCSWQERSYNQLTIQNMHSVIRNLWHISTPTCFGTSVPSSGSRCNKGKQPNMPICYYSSNQQPWNKQMC